MLKPLFPYSPFLSILLMVASIRHITGVADFDTSGITVMVALPLYLKYICFIFIVSLLFFI